MVRVTVWGENVHEQREPEVRERYPEGMHGAIAAGLSELLGDQVRSGPRRSTSPITASRRR